MGDLSPHFDRREFTCRHCLRVQVDPALVRLLEAIRAAHYPRGLRVVSGYRCPDHNRAVGGAPKSMHLQGKAADIPPRMTEAQAKACGARGIGVDAATGLVVHVDVGPVRPSWRYGKDGKVIA